jgi:dolichyl-phosphate beta-glucosyltransferase
MKNDMDVRLSVIIPAYNEELRLPNTLAQSIEYLQSQSYRSEILIVNDGSTDATDKIANDLSACSIPVRLLTHPDGANHGKGASVKRGMLAARGAFRLFMDADNSTTLNQIENFWPLFDRGCRVVIGSRALQDSVIGVRQARYKEIAGRIGNWIIRTFAVPGISDTQAGFKMFCAEEAEALFSRQTIDRWGYDIELLAIAQLHRYRIGEVPITWINAMGSKVTLGSYVEVLGEVRHIRRNLKAGAYS